MNEWTHPSWFSKLYYQSDLKKRKEIRLLVCWKILSGSSVTTKQQNSNSGAWYSPSGTQPLRLKLTPRLTACTVPTAPAPGTVSSHYALCSRWSFYL